MSMEAVLACAIAVWFGFYLINHARLFDRLRAALSPLLPGWLKSLLHCPLCVCFWAMSALSLFTGWIPLIVLAPPCTLFIELAFQKLRNGKK
jgi:hypothetical protein